MVVEQGPVHGSSRQRLIPALAGFALLVLVAVGCSDADPAPGSVEAPPLAVLDQATSDLGGYESSRGRGSLIAHAQRHFFPVAQMGPDWTSDFAPLDQVPECQSDTAQATVVGAMSLFDEAGFQATFTNRVKLTIEVHPDPTAASARAEARIGSERVACQTAALEDLSLRSDPEFERYESPNPGGRLIEPHIDRPGFETAEFDLTLVNPGLSVPITRTATSWADGDMTFWLTILTHDDSNAAIAKRFVEAIDAQQAPTDVEGDEAVDAAVEKLRTVVLQDETVAEFFDFVMPMQAAMHIMEDTNDCSSDYTDPVALEVEGPLWLTAQGNGLVAQSSVVFASEEAAARELARISAMLEQCVVEGVLPLLPGTNEMTATRATALTVDGVDVTAATVDHVQTIDGPQGSFSADGRVAVAAAQYEEVVLTWYFQGLAGDEPDLTALVAQSINQAQAS